MPQITYIDTEAPHRERHSRATAPSRTAGRWKSMTRWIVRHRLTILGVMALYRFAGLGSGEMQQWDEGIYALRAQVILHFGALWDQSAFMLNGTYYSAHPPLYVWLSTAFLLLFGDQLWVYRLTSALAAALLVPLLYRFSRTLQSPVKSLVVAGLFAVAPLPVLYSRLGQLDLLLTLCMTAALYFAFRAVRDGKSVDIMLAGGALGAALMTKLLFALSVPAAVLLSAVLLEGTQRIRAVRTALLMTLISFPLWVPWAWSFAAAHGNGAGVLFSTSLPLGATLAGLEGSAKETGSFYYLNQLIVHLSVLFPFALFSMWRSFFRPVRAGWIGTTLMIVLTLAALLIMRSMFEIYLIPILPLLFLHAVRGVALLRRESRPLLLSISMAAALCLPWSLVPWWRAAMHEILHGLTGGAVTWNAAMSGVFLLLATAVALLAVWQLYRRNRLRTLLSLPLTGTVLLAFALSACVRIWIIVPAANTDGAAAAAAALRMSNASQVFLIGKGDNPQLTFYLDGADIGWKEGEDRRYEWLDPHTFGVEGIRARIESGQRGGPVAVLIERNEDTQQPERNEREMLPRGFSQRLRCGRYSIAGGPRLVLTSHEKNEQQK